MTIAEQRAATRYPADWAARYRLARSDGWQACRVVDVSTTGAAIELDAATLLRHLLELDHRPTRTRAIDSIEVQFASITGDEMGASVRGTIRRHARLGSGALLLGIEFRVLNAEERNLLDLLVALRTRL